MRFSRRAFLASTAIALSSAAQSTKPRPRRADSFLGFHFDLHPSNRDTVLGRDVTEEMVEHFLERTRPDFVQYDYKGHVGYVAHPSNISKSAPNVRDSLAIWRKVTARRGIALYIHFSGVLDGVAVADHPEWARVGPDGVASAPTARDSQTTSTFSPYVDERMIPQLKEAIEKYDIDGVWVDGDCWGTKPDYSPTAAKAWRAFSGIEALPKNSADPGWQQFLEFNRRQFRQYVKHYADELHAFKPGFQVASNWLYSTLAPERPDLPVDYLSGDYLGNASISTARLEARYLASTGKPWDLMAWGFHTSGPAGHTHKLPVQLNQEASVVLAQGGGFQIYYQPTRAGNLDTPLVNVMAKVSAFCRARQSLSHKSEAVPQVGLVFSKKSLYEDAPPRWTRSGRATPAAPPRAGTLFGSWGALSNPARGLLDALVQCHYSVDVIPDWKLAEAAGRYPLVAVPDWANLGEEVKEILTAHVNKGGKLLLTGAANARLFAKELGVTIAEPPSEQTAYIAGDEVFGNVSGLWQDVEPAGAELIESRSRTYDSSREVKCAATLSRFGSGRIAAIYGPAGSVFAQTHAAPTRRFIGRVAARIFRPMVELDAPPTVDMALRRKNGKLLMHLGNCTAMQVSADYVASDFVPPVGPLRIRLRTAKKPKRVTLEPEGRKLEGTWRDGVWTGVVDRLEIHAIVAFEP